MVQILAGLITYLLLAIYCQENYKEKVSINRVRELRIQMMNESRELKPQKKRASRKKSHKNYPRAKT